MRQLHWDFADQKKKNNQHEELLLFENSLNIRILARINN